MALNSKAMNDELSVRGVSLSALSLLVTVVVVAFLYLLFRASTECTAV